MCPCCFATMGGVVASGGRPSTDAFQPPVLRMRGAGGRPPGRGTGKPEMMRKHKGAVIYGAGGAVGGAVVRACAREEGGHAVSHRAPPGARRRCRQGSAFRRRTRRDGGGRRARRTRRGPASTVGDRHGGPRRYLVPRDRHRVEHDAAGCARGRAGGRAMLPADCRPTPGRTV